MALSWLAPNASCGVCGCMRVYISLVSARSLKGWCHPYFALETRKQLVA